MRGFTRSVAIGILILSCGDNSVGPQLETCAEPDRVALYPDWLQLVMGSADHVWAEVGCGEPGSGAGIEWTIRDLSVASFGTDPSSPIGPDEPRRVIEPQAPGHTFVVIEVDGRMDSVAVSVPDTVVMGAVTQIGVGGFASCAITDDETAWCWGNGEVLGQWPQDRSTGTCWGSPCSPMPVPRKDEAHSVYTSGAHACALDGSSEAWCWGENYAGQLGSSAGTFSSDPASVSGSMTFTALTLGSSHSCGLASNGDAHCWGDSDTGRLGGGQRNGPAYAPELVAGDHEFVSLDARRETTCGATGDGQLYCWGILENVPGTEVCEELETKDAGVVAIHCSYVPLRMPLEAELSGDTLFVQVSGSCARTALGSVFCYNEARGSYAPQGGFGPMAVISGEVGHTCGLTEDGSAWCWGSNREGQLGDGTRTDRAQPVPVAGGHTFSQISVGDRHSCGLTTGTEVWCWGGNGVGQAGASILSQPSTPVKVRGQG